MGMVKSTQVCDDCEASWYSKDELSQIIRINIWLVSKDTPVRSEMGLPYTWSVISHNGTYMASGHAKSYKDACSRASHVRFTILHGAVGSYKAPEYLSDSVSAPTLE